MLRITLLSLIDIYGHKVCLHQICIMIKDILGRQCYLSHLIPKLNHKMLRGIDVHPTAWNEI